MARVTFTDEINIKPARQNYPKLTKLQKGEKVRIQLVDPTNIEMEFVHNLQAPVIENGEGVIDPNTGKYKLRFMGNPISFGDISILEDKGLDVKNCPISKFAKEHPDWVDAPKRKFAMHIIQYKTRPGTFKIANPFQVEHKIWVFTERTFLQLREFAETWGDLKTHDLLIECENAQFQNYNIQVAPEAAWFTEGDEATKQTLAVYKGGLEEYSDLGGAIGSRKEVKWVKEDLEEIADSWNIVLGKAKTSGFSAPEGMTDFLAAPSDSSEDDDTQDALAAIIGEPKKSEKESLDINSLLANLG